MRKKRNISFQDVIEKIEKGEIISDQPHPNKERYSNQRIYVLFLNNYVYVVPYIETEKKIFLKTVYPNRKFTKQYLKGGKNEKEKI